MSEADSYRKSAKLAYKGRNFAAAVELYARAIEADPEAGPEVLASDRAAYAAALTGANRLDEAAVEMEHAVALTPADAPLRYKLGEVLSRLGRHGEAIPHLEEAARLAPDVADHHWRLAMELRTLGRGAEANRALQAALKVNPNHTPSQILQLEQVLISTPERDGQAYEAQRAVAGAERRREDDTGLDGDEDAASRRMFRPPPQRPPIRHRLWMVVAEAVGLLLFSLWIQSLFLA